MGLFVGISLLIGANLSASNDENSVLRTITEVRDVPVFNGVDAGGIFTVIIRKGSPQELKITAEEEVLPKINTEVKNQILFISSRNLRNPGKLIVEITMPELIYINASGASTFRTEGDFTSQEFILKASGAANVVLEMQTRILKSDISGAADVKLSGSATSHLSEVSGAASLKAFELETDTLSIDLSGAADARVDVKKQPLSTKVALPICATSLVLRVLPLKERSRIRISMMKITKALLMWVETQWWSIWERLRLKEMKKKD